MTPERLRMVEAQKGSFALLNIDYSTFVVSLTGQVVSRSGGQDLLQNVARQISILDDVLQLFLHVVCVDDHLFLL